MSLINNDELVNLNTSIENVPEEDFLSLGVYRMVIESIKRKQDRNGHSYLEFLFNTLFKKKDSEEYRKFYQTFHLEGEFKPGKPKIDNLAKFLKRCFGIAKLTPEALEGIVGKEVAVGTKKDEKGYITFWFADNIENLKSLKAKYKAKDQSNGQTPNDNNNNSSISTIHAQMDESSNDEEGGDLPF